MHPLRAFQYGIWQISHDCKGAAVETNAGRGPLGKRSRVMKAGFCTTLYWRTARRRSAGGVRCDRPVTQQGVASVLGTRPRKSPRLSLLVLHGPLAPLDATARALSAP